jgi:hypothetical protein
MNVVAILNLAQFLGVILALVAAVALGAFVVWCAVGAILWFASPSSHETIDQPMTDPEWFDLMHGES